MISIKNIYWMLAYAFSNLNKKENEKVNKEEFDNIYELFCVMLTNEMSKIIKKGLHKEYITEKDEISNLHGKILINESIKQNSKIKMKMVCEYDEYSANNYLNQIIKTSLLYIIKSKKVKDELKIKKLKNILNYLKEVQEISINKINWTMIKYNRNNKSYAISINISHLLLDGLIVNKQNGNIEFRNYIDDQKMHKLYEKFILEYYRYHHKELNASVPQIKWNVEENNMIVLLPKMQTDIALFYEKRILIIDAKYYSNMYQNNPMFNKETFKSNNLYQIFTYVKNEDTEKTGNVSGLLLYAKTDSNDKQWSEFNMDGNKIIISNLDMSKDFETVSNHLEMIAEKFKMNEI